MLDANPGRPGAPISIPGLPIETASGGIKAPQYFALGVAGDHGDTIAQYSKNATEYSSTVRLHGYVYKSDGQAADEIGAGMSCDSHLFGDKLLLTEALISNAISVRVVTTTSSSNRACDGERTSQSI